MKNDCNITTWDGLNIDLIEKTYNKIAPLIARRMCDKDTRDFIKQLMTGELPLYDIKCDEENNPPEAVYSGHIFVRVSKISPDETYNYIDVIF